MLFEKRGYPRPGPDRASRKRDHVLSLLLVPLLVSVPDRRVVDNEQNRCPSEFNVQKKRSAGVCDDEEVKRASSEDDAGVSGLVSGGRRCRKHGGRKADKGHQKRHQEWLDKFGEVEFTPLVSCNELSSQQLA